MTQETPKTQMSFDKKTLVAVLRSLKVGEDKIFPITKLISLRGTITRLKFILNMRFSCKVNETQNEDEERTCTVTRTK